MNANNRNTRGNPRGPVARALGMTALLALFTLFAVPVLAQSQEIGNVNSYAPEKTRADYENGSSDFDYSTMDLRVGVWLDRNEDEIYNKGEEMGVGFQANQDAYAVVYRIDSEGLVSILWPRSRFDDGFAFGGHEYLLPVSGARKLRVATVQGEGYVEAVISKYPFDLRDLEIDFHHEEAANRFNFRVAGDPFLAINEVNFAVTGLEDSEEYVVTNYTSYYVHQAVDHPRYLCNQCHFEDDVAYEPYRDTCTLEISYDYGWSNNWYADYGYYPVYGNPVYVYVDPWTWRPWVNFWYYPSYVCAPYYGYGWGSSYCYSWGYSPYYRGDCYTNYNSGYQRYKPLSPGGSDGTRTKTREYASASRMVKGEGPDNQQRDAMASRTRMKEPDAVRGSANSPVSRSADGRYKGEGRTVRSRPEIDSNVRARGTSGLRIRDGGSVRGGSRTSAGKTPDSGFRHTAGGANGRSTFTPVSRTNRSGGTSPTQVRGSSGASGAADSRSVGSRPGSSSPGKGGASSRSIKPVEPRKKGTRVWNSGRSGQGTDRGSRNREVRPGSGSRGKGSSADRTRSVQPRSRDWSSGDRGSRSNVKPRSGSSKSSSKSSSGSKSSSVKSRSNSSSKSQKSSGGSSRGSGGSSKSGSRGSGRGSGSSRGR